MADPPPPELEVEALLREVLGSLLHRTAGAEWEQRLSGRIRRSLKRVHDAAQGSREGVPDDPWLTAGLNEIREVATFFLSEIHEKKTDYSATDPDGILREAFDDLGWKDVYLCRADIERLKVARHHTAHPDVVHPLSSAQADEVQAIVKRLLLGCERVRRRLMDLEEEWFPYITTVSCPGIPEWEYRRGSNFPIAANLNEGDQIEFVVSAVNTNGSDEQLRYGLLVQADGGSFVTAVDDEREGRLTCRASPPGREVGFCVAVRDVGGGHDASDWDDEVCFQARIRPQQSTRT